MHAKKRDATTKPFRAYGVRTKVSRKWLEFRMWGSGFGVAWVKVHDFGVQREGLRDLHLGAFGCGVQGLRISKVWKYLEPHPTF